MTEAKFIKIIQNIKKMCNLTDKEMEPIKQKMWKKIKNKIKKSTPKTASAANAGSLPSVFGRS